jgi:hypothetical protein
VQHDARGGTARISGKHRAFAEEFFKTSDARENVKNILVVESGDATDEYGILWMRCPD